MGEISMPIPRADFQGDGGRFPGFHPNGMKIIQPKVARNELPWVSVPTFINPERNLCKSILNN
jgi:hypothetical protein